MFWSKPNKVNLFLSIQCAEEVVAFKFVKKVLYIEEYFY